MTERLRSFWRYASRSRSTSLTSSNLLSDIEKTTPGPSPTKTPKSVPDLKETSGKNARK